VVVLSYGIVEGEQAMYDYSCHYYPRCGGLYTEGICRGEGGVLVGCRIRTPDWVWDLSTVSIDNVARMYGIVQGYLGYF